MSLNPQYVAGHGLLKGRSVLITAAAGAGIGFSAARRCAEEGCRALMISDIHPRRLEEAVARLKEETGLAEIYGQLCNVTNEEEVQALVAAAEHQLGGVDVLINNAGLALGVDPVPKALLEDWETMIATNVAGLATVTHRVLPEMVARGCGTIINIGSVAGETPYPGGNVYGATKAFVEQFTRNLRADLVGTGVRATNLAPGLCGGSEFSQVRLRGNEAAAAKVYEGTQPLSCEDIADTAYWIATQPAHINIVQIEMMPTCQGYAGYAVKRRPAGN